MWYGFFKSFMGPLIKLLAPTRIEGAENVPRTGGAVLAGNHISYAETLIVPANLPRKVTFPAKAELFHQKGFGGRIVSWFLRSIGMVPMDRSGGRASAQSMGQSAQVLADGGLLGIYPEGTRSPDGRLYKGRTGMARLALTADVPVVPVASIGTEFTKGFLGIPRVRRAHIIFGEPLDFSAWTRQATDGAVLRWVTDVTLAEVQKLSGQSYVDVYATSVKRGIVTAEEIKARVAPGPRHAHTPPPTDVEVAAQPLDPGAKPLATEA